MSLPVSASGRRFGCLKDKPDHRDLGVARAPFGPGLADVAVVDLESFCGPVRDQGQEGSCTAHAGVGMREFLYRKYLTYEKVKVDPPPLLSPSFLYYVERELDGTLDQGDCGSYGRTVVMALNRFGVCPLVDEPYVPGDVSTAPTMAQLKNAMSFMSGAYHRIATVADMKSCLASQYVFVIGFVVYEQFESLTAADPVYRPDKSTSVLGGHEVLVIGYDDARSAFKVRNSWGAGWGASGNFWFPYATMADPDILMDAWMCHLGKAW